MKMDLELFHFLKPHDNWFNNEGEEQNSAAKNALNVFYRELLKRQPSKKYTVSLSSFPHHMFYLRHLIAIKEALREKKYQRACNELVTLMYYEPFFQGRIFYNVLRTLEDELPELKGA